MSLVGLLRKLKEITRQDPGIDGDAQRLGQFVWLIFLKVFDYREEESELNENYQPVIPEGYRWRDWAVGKSAKEQLTGPDLIDFVNNKLIPVLSGLPITIDNKQVLVFDKTDNRSMLVKTMMADATNYMKNGYLLRDVVNVFNGVNFEDSYESHEFNDIYEELLRGLQSAGTMGEFYTGRGITHFCVDKIDPKLGETMADWACGTGGFMIDTLEHLKPQVEFGNNKQMEMLQKSVRGGEYKPMPYKLVTTNLLLHGIDLPNVKYGDSLAEKQFSEYYGDDLVDIACLNPPYGGVALPDDKLSFPADMRSSETAELFVALTVKRLKKNGRAVMVLPDGFLFGNESATIAIKKYLTKECNLHTIIRLPQSCFSPYTSIATNLLFFDKTGPTSETWFYRLDMPDGYKHFSKTKPIKREHFLQCDDWWANRFEIKDVKKHEDSPETWKSQKFSIEELEFMNYNLDQCGYPAEEKIILSPKETIKNFIEKREMLDREMDAKLAKIMSLLAEGE